jgi:hypothetical protein
MPTQKTCAKSWLRTPENDHFGDVQRTDAKATPPARTVKHRKSFDVLWQGVFACA